MTSVAVGTAQASVRYYSSIEMSVVYPSLIGPLFSFWVSCWVLTAKKDRSPPQADHPLAGRGDWGRDGRRRWDKGRSTTLQLEI